MWKTAELYYYTQYDRNIRVIGAIRGIWKSSLLKGHPHHRGPALHWTTINLDASSPTNCTKWTDKYIETNEYWVSSCSYRKFMKILPHSRQYTVRYWDAKLLWCRNLQDPASFSDRHRAVGIPSTSTINIIQWRSWPWASNIRGSQEIFGWFWLWFWVFHGCFLRCFHLNQSCNLLLGGFTPCFTLEITIQVPDFMIPGEPWKKSDFLQLKPSQLHPWWRRLVHVGPQVHSQQLWLGCFFFTSCRKPAGAGRIFFCHY